MKNNRFYAVVFTTGLCCACALILTFANTRWQKRIAANESFARIRAIVEALGLDHGTADRGQIIRSYNESVTVTTPGEMTVFEARLDGKLAGYAVEVVGRGKYGPIKGILSFGPQRRKIMALNIYEQNETPGLGTKITAEGKYQGKMVPWFTQVHGLKTAQLAVDKDGGGVQAVAGATISSRTVVNSLKEALAALEKELGGFSRPAAVPADSLSQQEGK